MKPKIKLVYGIWLCGGNFIPPWYIDWYAGDTPKEAYEAWKAGTRNE